MWKNEMRDLKTVVKLNNGNEHNAATNLMCFQVFYHVSSTFIKHVGCHMIESSALENTCNPAMKIIFKLQNNIVAHSVSEMLLVLC